MKSLRHTILLLLMPLAFQNLIAQDGAKDNPWGISFQGFIKSDVWYDSRQIVGARDDLFLLYPKAPERDRNGVDINDIHSYNFSAITSRLSGIIKGPDAFGAKSTAFMEGDFSGWSNPDISGFRLRHAYVKLQWEHSQVLFGHYWHPLFVPEVFPSVLSLNTGAPFQPFIRSPQLQFTYQAGSMKFILAALSQLDYMNDGPDGPSAKYLRQSGVPNLHMQVQYLKGNLTGGAAIDYKSILPKRLSDSLEISYNKVPGWSYMGYAKFHKAPLLLKAKVIYGQNLTEHLLLGGYAIKSYDTLHGMASYTPSQHLFYWANILYSFSSKFDAGVFAGYSQNLGTVDPQTGVFYGRGSNIDYAYRIAPIIIFKSGKVQLMTELEYTVAAYGIPEKSGKVRDSKETGNVRLQVTAFHFF